MTSQDVGSPILTSPSPMISPASLDESDTEVESPLTAPEREEALATLRRYAKREPACSSMPAADSSAATPSSSATAAGSSATAPSSATAKSTPSAAKTRRDRKIRAGKQKELREAAKERKEKRRERQLHQRDFPYCEFPLSLMRKTAQPSSKASNQAPKRSAQ